MKLSQIINLETKQALLRLSEQKLSIKTAYKLKTILKSIDEEINKYEQIRLDLLHQFGNKDASGQLEIDANNNVVIEPDKMKEFLKKHNELLDLDVELGSISLSEFDNQVKISTKDMLVIGDIIVE